MLASVLERLLHKNSELDSNVEKVNGHILPDFEKIAPFLQPSGIKIRTTDYGWEFGGLLLSSQPTSDLSASYEVGTARVSNSESESKR